MSFSNSLLVMSLVLTGEWMRSLSIADLVVYAYGRDSIESKHVITVHCLFSANGKLTWSSGLLRSSNAAFTDEVESRYQYPCWKTDSSIAKFGSSPLTCIWNGGDFAIQQYPSHPDQIADFVFAPYWSIILPLTMLSAYLLLSKPHVLTHKKRPEPTANDGGSTS